MTKHDDIETDAFSALKRELGAVESATLDQIHIRRREGSDFSTIASELNRSFPPPPWRARWELPDVIEVHGWRR